MRYTHIKTIILLAAAMLLGGCSREVNESGIKSSSESSSTISSTDISQPVSSTESSSTVSSTQSRPESVVITPVEYTDEDRELQKILSDLTPPVIDIFGFIGNMAPNPVLEFRFPQLGSEDISHFGLIHENHRTANDLFELPTTRDGFEKLLLRCFSAEFTKRHMDNIPVCTMTENPDGTYNVTITGEIDQFITHGFFPSKFLEIDGRLYQREGLHPGSFNIDCKTAKIISKTDDMIEFSYLNDIDTVDDQLLFKGNYKNEPYYSQNAIKGTLKYERDGWKLNSFND